MATSATTLNKTTGIRLFRHEVTAKNIRVLRILQFVQLIDLCKYVCTTINTVKEFTVIIPGECLEEFLNDPVYRFDKVAFIKVYYNNMEDVKRAGTRYSFNQYSKLHFCLDQDIQRHLDIMKVDNATSPSREINREVVRDVASSHAKHISAKKLNTISRHSTVPKSCSSIPRYGYPVRDMEQINSKYICPSCKLIFYEPYQLNCGHRTCQCCINIKNDQMSCLTCLGVSSSKNIWFDQGFRNDMQRLPISCSACDWRGDLKFYQEHIDQKHHTDVYAQRIEQSSLREHGNTAETHRQILSDIPSCAYLTYNNDQHQNVLPHLKKQISITSNTINKSKYNQQQIFAAQNSAALKTFLEANVRGLEINQDLLAQDVWSLRQTMEDGKLTSHDGTIIWKITSIQEKIANAQSERQKSIYSPPFYSSKTGYKMCLRLYLNGDGDTRDTYLSLFFVLMRGEHDAILQWPFSYKVTFCLIDQSTSDNHRRNVTDYFWPNITTTSFQRPVYNMNDAYGIKNFYSLIQFEENLKRYVRDDTIFIEAKVDFSKEGFASLTTSGTRGLPNDDRHVDTINENFMNID